MASNSPTPAPPSRLFRQWRRRFLPISVWIISIGALAILGKQQMGSLHLVGEVERRQAIIAPIAAGKISDIKVDLYDLVEAGTVIAMMDDAILRAQLATLDAELTRLRADLDAQTAQFAQDEADIKTGLADEQRRYALNEEDARLDLLDRRAEQETDAITLQSIEIQMNRQEALVRELVGDQATLDDLKMRYKALNKKINENATAISAARTQLNEASTRRQRFEAAPAVVAPVDSLLEPVRRAINVQEALLNEMGEQRSLLVLASPIAGVVTQVSKRIGENVMAGEPAFMVTAKVSGRVIAYIDERSSSSLQPGAEVRLVSRRGERKSVTAKVIKLGNAIEPLPPHISPSILLGRWGLPILISQGEDSGYYPGELVDVYVNQR